MKKQKDFANKEDWMKYLVDKSQEILAVKMAQTKETDCGISIACYDGVSEAAKQIVKSLSLEVGKAEPHVLVTVAINTTKFMDSHDDVHIDGLWDEGLKQNKNLPLLKEHKFNFDNILAKGIDVEVKTVDMEWKDLGYEFEGKTQALVFVARIYKSRNKEMYENYKDGYVDNHSVGMKYVETFFAVKDAEGEFGKNWETYYPMIANKSLADKKEYFIAVTKAIAVEGSAVPIGSNSATPTLDIEAREKAIKTFLGTDFVEVAKEKDFTLVKTFLGVEKKYKD